MAKYSLSGIDGNAFSILAYTTKMLRECGYPSKDIEDYKREATKKGYEHTVRVSMDMVKECNEKLA